MNKTPEPKSPRITLVAKNEGLLYDDKDGLLLHFDISLKDGRWTVHLPCSRGVHFCQYVMSEEEHRVVIPRIVTALQCIKWLGVFPRHYAVEVVNDARSTPGGSQVP